MEERCGTCKWYKGTEKPCKETRKGVGDGKAPGAYDWCSAWKAKK